MKSLSPLRYPGGKASLVNVLAKLIIENKLAQGIYVEPFAGGAGAALGLLEQGHASRILINDADRRIFCLWKSIMARTEDLVDRIMNAELSLTEWNRQRDIYRQPGRRSHLDIGFAAFYMNRCNRSGIMVNGGPIGGYEQKGKWKIDARFNRTVLVKKIREISTYGDRIIIANRDALDLIENLADYCQGLQGLLYADPPYYVKGSQLYWRYYKDEDHRSLAQALRRQTDLAWVMTYDNVPEIREMYSDYKYMPFSLHYSASKPKKGQELMILGNGVTADCLSDWENLVAV
ncbi:MAG: DNA adenine methylase [Opitutales bacterium]|nr:DNA adenine methylase [Opitutales bacterium]